MPSAGATSPDPRPAGASQHLAGLQVLRAFAAMMVVVTHAGLKTPGAPGWLNIGETGVDIFFVISGFVMAWTTARVDHSTAPIGTRVGAALSFIGKRLLRILPLYYLALLWTARGDVAKGHFSGALLKDFLFIPHPSLESPQIIFPTLVQGWTLNYEMGFYVLVALALLLPRRAVTFVSCVLAAVVLAGIALPVNDWVLREPLFIWRGDPNDTAGLLAHFYTNNIILEFGFGFLLAGCVRSMAAPAWPRWCFFALLGIAVAALCVGHGHWPRALWMGVPAALVVWSAIHAFAGMRLPFLELMGAASYAVYLFHWTGIGLANAIAARLGVLGGDAVRVALMVCADIVLAGVVGVAVHLALERPFMRAVAGKTRFS